MSRSELDPPRRCALLVCELTSTIAPHEARARLIEERRSHLYESACAGTPSAADLFAALRGSVDDLRGSLAARRTAGLAPVCVAVFTDSSASLAACAAFLVVMLPTVFLFVTPLMMVVRWTALALASLVLFGGYVTRVVQRRRS